MQDLTIGMQMIITLKAVAAAAKTFQTTIYVVVHTMKSYSDQNQLTNDLGYLPDILLLQVQIEIRKTQSQQQDKWLKVEPWKPIELNIILNYSHVNLP